MVERESDSNSDKTSVGRDSEVRNLKGTVWRKPLGELT